MSKSISINHNKHKKWGCKIENVVLTKGLNGENFTLRIDKLDLVKTQSMCNKLPIMGKTGSGKSTLLNLLSAMELPQRGTISWTFPGVDTPIKWDCSGLSSTESKKLRQEYIGYSFQDSSLISHLTVLDNLCYPLLLKNYSQCDAHDKAMTALKEVLTDNEDALTISRKYPSHLSGGQRQRVALVQAMIHDPYVLFTDEPTGNLDIDTRMQVMNVLLKWVDKSEGDKLLFWVTHHVDDPKIAGATNLIYVNNGFCKIESVEKVKNKNSKSKINKYEHRKKRKFRERVG